MVTHPLLKVLMIFTAPRATLSPVRGFLTLTCDQIHNLKILNVVKYY
jgi:hypothetical protein